LIDVGDVSSTEDGRPLFNSNGPLLAALVERDGGLAEPLPIARDNRSLLHASLAQGLESDVLITTGGVSVGAYDYVREELEKLGVRVLFHQVAIRPGRPVLFGLREKPKRTLVFGLPGNPVSTFVTYEVFVRPALRKMLGCSVLERPLISVRLEETIKKKAGPTHFVRGVVGTQNGELTARTTGPQGSHLLTSVLRANALLVLPEDRNEVREGDLVSALFLGDPIALG
jgi:molybdopterin molybdotransferase